MKRLHTPALLLSLLTCAAGPFTNAQPQTQTQTQAPPQTQPQTQPQLSDIQPLLDQGQFPQARALLQARLAEQPDDADARLALGVTTFLAGVEEFSQTMFRYGPRYFSELGMMMPLLSVPVRQNAQPQPFHHDDLIDMLERFEESLNEVDAILEPIGDADAHMPLRIGTVRMDLDGNGELTDDESLWKFFAAITQPNRRWQPEPDPQQEAALAEKVQQFVLGLDTADAYWLRGYCHVMAGFTNVALAHDTTELFNHTAHLFFPSAQTPYPWLANTPRQNQFDFAEISDLIAMIHLLNLPVRDADRMAAAHEHFLQVIAISRKSWKSILAETDNTNEWVPGPNQTGVIGIDLNQQQIDAWLAFLDEAESILTGQTLLPFWRGDNPKLGINLRKAFTEPTALDLVLWIQGSAAAPYLQEGKLTDPDFWDRLNNDFGRNFPGFAFWIN